MSGFFKKSYFLVKEAMVDDHIDRYLLIISFLGSILIWFIWYRFLSSPDYYIYTKFSLYPVQFLAVVLVLNTTLAIFSYAKEKEISYLLMIGNLIAIILIFCLEIFYLTSLN